MADAANTAASTGAGFSIYFYASIVFFAVLILFVIFATFPRTTRASMIFLDILAVMTLAGGIVLLVKKQTDVGFVFLIAGAFLLIWGLIFFKVARRKPAPAPAPAPAPGPAPEPKK